MQRISNAKIRNVEEACSRQQILIAAIEGTCKASNPIQNTSFCGFRFPKSSRWTKAISHLNIFTTNISRENPICIKKGSNKF
mmetsp:Transcript_7092/g.14639  ORF Transcript_7092/g.14639 Transcript_7092/m.14639 type:complete len:82 (+) Transcript_7092:340-585(+)